MATIYGTSGNDIIDGTKAADTIRGLGGNDMLFGLGGADTIYGGGGGDVIHGDSSNDYMPGTSGRPCKQAAQTGRRRHPQRGPHVGIGDNRGCRLLEVDEAAVDREIAVVGLEGRQVQSGA